MEGRNITKTTEYQNEKSLEEKAVKEILPLVEQQDKKRWCIEVGKKKSESQPQPQTVELLIMS